MSKDETESVLPADVGAEPSPGPGGPGASNWDVDGMTLRQQVMELINSVLADPAPERGWAKAQLRELLAAHPDDPERALLEHLITTRRRTAAAEHDALPAHGHLSGPPLSEEPRKFVVPVGIRSKRRIEAVLGDKMLLTAFQPIRELPGGRVTGFEALTRFVSRDGASADTWFREAAALGIGTDLEVAALRCALAAAREIPPHLFVAFNLTPATLSHSRVQALLEDPHLPMDRIIVELTERVSDPEWNNLIGILAPLREKGLRLAVDGSGPDTAPAEQIRRLQPDIIKVDRTFIESILNDEKPDGSAVIRLAREVGAFLAAEGIETQAELESVIRAGMTAGQGYLLGRPSVHPLDWSAWSIQAETMSTGTSH